MAQFLNMTFQEIFGDDSDEGRLNANSVHKLREKSGNWRFLQSDERGLGPDSALAENGGHA